MNAWSIEAAAAEAGDRTALIFERGEWTFAKWAERVREMARALAGAGVDFRTDGSEPGRVMLVADNTERTLSALVALIERGVPIMLVHPRSTPAERDALAAQYPPALRLDVLPAAIDRGPVPPVVDVPTERDLAVFFTSGTTGQPKAVRLSRRAFFAAAAASAKNLGWQEDDRWLLTLPVAHIGGLSIPHAMPARPSVHRPCRRASRTDATRSGVRGTPSTLLSLVPTILGRWLPVRPPASLRAVLLGGAPTPPALHAEAVGQGWPILTTYGLTEACSQVTVQRYGVVSAPDDCGRALPGTDLDHS